MLHTCINQIQMSPTESETDKTRCETKTFGIKLIEQGERYKEQTKRLSKQDL